MDNKNLFELFDINIDKDLIMNPTPDYNHLIEDAIKKKIDYWDKLCKKNLGKRSDQAKIYLKKVHEEQFHQKLVDPIRRKEYFLKIKEEKKQELRDLIDDSSNYDEKKSSIHKRFTDYLTEIEIIEIEKQVEKEDQKYHFFFSEEIIKKLAEYQAKLKEISGGNLLEALGINEDDSYLAVKKKIVNNKEKSIVEYEEPLNQGKADVRIRSDLLIYFSAHVLVTEEFEQYFEQYMRLLRYSPFIESLNAIRGRDITNSIYNKLIDQAEREQLDKTEFIDFLSNIYIYFNIKRAIPLINDLNEEVKNIVQNAQDAEYKKGRKELSKNNLDEALQHFKEANRIDSRYALFELGDLYYEGTANEAKDIEHAMDNYVKATNYLDIGENKNALFRLGKIFIQKNSNHYKGFNYLQKFVKMVSKGDTSANPYCGEAFLILGDCHYNGIATKQDLKEALDCYHKGAKAGSSAAEKKAKKLQRELTMKSKVIASISIVSFIALLTISLNLMEKIFAGALTQENVYIYFGIMFTWMIMPKLFVYFVYPCIKFEKWNLVNKLDMPDWRKPVEVMRWFIMLYGGICFLLLWKDGYIQPWLSKEVTEEIPDILTTILNFGINHITIAILIQVIYPLWILSKNKNEYSYPKEKKRKLKNVLSKTKNVMKIIIVLFILIGAVNEAIQIEVENILSGFSFLDYFTSLVLLCIATLTFYKSTTIKELLGESLFPFVLFSLLLYGALVCALVAENGYEIPFFSMGVQVILGTLFCVIFGGGDNPTKI